MLSINSKMLGRLAELEEDLRARRARAEAEAWLGEIEGIDLTLRFLTEKRQQAERLQKITGAVQLGMPVARRPVKHRGAYMMTATRAVAPMRNGS